MSEEHRAKCIVCGDVLRRQREKYCSKKCQGIDGRKYFKCRRCSKVFARKRSGGKNIFCSRACAFRLKRSKRFAETRKKRKPRATPLFFINCIDCGGLITSRTNRPRRCEGCVTTQRKRCAFNKYGAKRECLYCGKTFEFSDVARRHYCSEICRKKGFVECARKHKRISRHVRRVRIRQAGGVERLDPYSIFERDGWRCQHCNKKTRRTYKITHDLYPNLDHIVPVSKGGRHSRDNVQTLCRACNLRKKDGLLNDQMLLIG